MTEIIISAVLGTIGFFAVMFRSEIKAKVVGYPAARRAKKYGLAMKGDSSARTWCREKLSDEQREEYYDAVRDDVEKLWHVMWAISPEMALDGPSPLTKESRPEFPPEAAARLNARIGKDR